jgi:hypothetical protein
MKNPLEDQVNLVKELKAQLEREEAILIGMKRYADHIGGTAQLKSQAIKTDVKRRMRLGSKKRVVFHLIANGLSNLESIAAQLTGSEIDHRNVRDIVREGIEKGDLAGILDSRFVLTAFGMELLDKAAKEDDWDSYSHLITERDVSFRDDEDSNYDFDDIINAKELDDLGSGLID